MKKILLSLALMAGFMMASKAEAMSYYEAKLRMERELNYICSVTIGARYGSDAYYDCRDYYDRRFYDYGLDWDYLTAAQITEFLSRTNPYIARCRNRGLLSALLWGCIRDYEDGYYRDWSHRHPHFKPRHEYRPHFEQRPHKPHYDKPHKPKHVGPAKPKHVEPHKPKYVEPSKPKHVGPAKPKKERPAKVKQPKPQKPAKPVAEPKKPEPRKDDPRKPEGEHVPGNPKDHRR